MHQRTVLSVNQLLMRNNDRYVIRGRYSLVLINVTSQDEGEYTCQVSSSPVLEQVSTVTVTGWFDSPAFFFSVFFSFLFLMGLNLSKM